MPDHPGTARDTRPAVIAVIIGAALWGTSGIAQEWGAPRGAPPSLAAVRTLGGGVLLLAVAVSTTGWAGILDALRRGRSAMGAAVVAMAMFQLAYLGSVRSTALPLFGAVLMVIGLVVVSVQPPRSRSDVVPPTRVRGP